MLSSTRTMTASFLGAILILGVCLMPAAALAAKAEELTGRWEGEINIPSLKLSINVDFRAGESGWEGDISIPAQGAKDLPLTNIVLEKGAVSFEIQGIPGKPTFKGTVAEDGQRISGEFSQAGQTFPFALERAVPPKKAAEEALEGFDEFLDKAMKDWKVPGLAVGIVVEGEVVYAKGFGQRDIEEDLPVTTKTLFAIGSCTKAFTTFLMGTLVDEGKLEWDKPVAAFLPGFKLYDEYATAHITPRDMVSHRSGLPRHDLVWYNNLTTSREELVRRLRYLEPNKELRQTYQYNNLMFTAAGYMAGKLAGSTWEEAVRTRIFEPLGMTRSNLTVADSQKSDDFAMPYSEDDGKIHRIPFRNINLVGPAGCINSCVDDMVRWVIVHLNCGEFQGKRILKVATCKEMHTPQMVVAVLPDEPDISPSSYALGWMTDTYRGHYRVAHAGAIDGFVSGVTLFPYDHLGIVALANKTATPLPGLVIRHAADRLLGLERRDWNAEALAKQELRVKEDKKAAEKKETQRKQGTTPARPLKEYAGDYEHPGYGILRIELEDDHLTMTYNGIVTPLEHWHYEVFNGLKNPEDPTFGNMKLTFRANSRGNVGSVSAPFEPATPEIVFTRKADACFLDPDYLKRFVGEYELADVTIVIGLRGNVLTADIPGEPQYELVPDQNGEFTLKGVSVVSARFVTDEEGRVTSVLINQPQGVFEAKKK
jgi:CubicO group peptidase (beta-lactamase class C family)